MPVHLHDLETFKHMLNIKNFRNKEKVYEAPEAEVIVYQVERNFMTDSLQSQDNYSGNYHLENQGLGNGGEIL